MPNYSTEAVYLSCWGKTEHTFKEKELSSCYQGCKVYVCVYCKREQVLHNAEYGCKRLTVAGEKA
jgi:hypothetical protein